VRGHIPDLQRLEELGKVASPSRARRMAALAQARAVRERILAERGGSFLPDVAEDLRRSREERDFELAGLC
jgi:hypothetical protein